MRKAILMMRKAILMMLVLSVVPAAWAKKHDRHDDDYSSYRISREETVVVSDYYRGKSLPPGLAKKLRRGGSLPPGWQKKIQPVPVVVEQRLAPVPAGCRRGIIDGAFVVYEPNRGVIVDVVASFGR
jgi:Ni/Co efflux regulator RcnB